MSLLVALSLKSPTKYCMALHGMVWYGIVLHFDMSVGDISGLNGKLILKNEFSLSDYNIKEGFQISGARINLDEPNEQ